MSNITALLSLVVPVFNEEENIPLLTDRICTALNGYTFELIFIDDCSTDGTREAIKKMQNLLRSKDSCMNLEIRGKIHGDPPLPGSLTP